MRWLKIITFTLAGLLATAALLLVSALLFIGHSDLSGVITRGVSKYTEHSIEFDGPVTIELSMHPVLKTAGVRFSMQDQLVELQSDDLRLQVDIPSLADGHLHVLDIGAHNTLVTVRLPAERAQDNVGTELDLKALTFDKIDIENLALDIYQSHEIEPLHIKVDVAQSVRNEAGVLSPVTVRGSVDGEAISLDGSVARGEADAAADRSFIVDLRAEVLQSSLHASGELAGDGGTAPTGDLSVQLDVPDVQAVLQLFHIGVPALGALTATGHLTGNPHALRLDGLEASLAREGVNVEVQGSIDNLNTVSGIDLSYTSNITDAGLLAWLLPDQLPQFDTLSYLAHVTGGPGRLVIVMERFEATDPDGHALNISGEAQVLDDEPYVEDLELAVSVSVPNLDYVRQFSEAVPKLGPVKATANVSMNGGVLAIRDIKATSTTGKSGRVDAEGEITHISFSPANVSGMAFSAGVKDVTAKQIGDALALDLPDISPVNAQAKYSGSDKKSVVSDLKLQAGRQGKVLLDAKGEIHLGVMGSDKPLTGMSLDVSLQAPDSAELGSLGGFSVPALGVVSGKAQVRQANGLTAMTSLDAGIVRGKDFHMQLNGSIDDLLNMKGLNMKLSMKAADLHALGKPFEVNLPREGAVSTAGNLRGSLEQLRYIGRTNLRNTTWSTDLTGAFSGKRPRIAGTIEVPVLDIHDVGLHPERSAREAEQTAQREAPVADDKPRETVPLFSNERIDVTWLRAVDLDVKVSIDKLTSTDASIEDIFTHVLLNDGKLDVQPLRYSVDEDLVTAGLMINAKPDIPRVGLQLEGTDVDLGLLLTNSPEQPAPIRGLMTAKAFLQSRGATQAQLAANLTGTINVVTENAKVKKSNLNLLNLDVMGWVLSNTVSLKKDVNIGCAIFSVKFDQGVGGTEMFIIDTEDTLIRVDADVDFTDETMYIAILPKRKVALFGNRKPMEIYGPITNPEYKLVSLSNLTMEASRATLLAPLTITGTLLENLSTLVGVEKEAEGTCNQFINH